MNVELSIRGELEPKPEKKKLELFLEQREDGSVILRADEKGTCNPWYILRINPNGTFFRYEALPNDIGLQIDEHGQIVEEI